MGWCSATEIFDDVMDALTEDSGVSPETKTKVAEVLYKSLTEQDWDCEYDSKYFDSILLDIMHKNGDVDDEEYDQFLKNPMNN